MEVMQHITDSGVADYLAKPVNPALLKMRVQASLEKRYAFEQRIIRSQEMQRTRRELEAAIQDLKKAINGPNPKILSKDVKTK